MNLFGMGINIDYKDNATAGLTRTEQAFRGAKGGAEEYVNAMNNQSQALNDMAVQGAAYTYMGGQMMGAGGKILNSMKDVGMSVVDTGADFENTRVTLEALYKSKELAEEKLKWAVDFGAKSPFDIKDVKGLMVGMKAIGIEIDKEVTSVGGHTQELLGYIGDLGALRPDVGLGRIGYAIRNAIGGNVRSLQMALDVDVEGLLGRKFSNDTEQATQDIADLVEALGAEGLMEKLFGTWGQMVSELSDQVERIKLSIADHGAFEGAKDILQKLFDLMSKISDKELEILGENLSDIFTSLLKPVGFVVDKFVVLVNWIKKMIMYNPEIVKLVLSVIAFAGAMTFLLGIMLVLGGGIMIVVSALGRFKMFLGSALRGVTFFGFGVKTALGGLALFVAKILLVIAVGKILYSLYKDSIVKVFSTLGEVFRIASLDLGGFIVAVENLKNSEDYFSSFGLAVLKTITFIEAMFSVWEANEMSDDLFQRMTTLGLIPMIEKFMDAKYAAEQFYEGLKLGIRDGIEFVKNLINKIVEVTGKVVDFLNKIAGVPEKVKGAKDELDGVNGEGFRQAGYWLGIFLLLLAGAGFAMLIAPLITAIGTVIGLLGGLSLPLLIVIGVIALVVYYWDDLVEAFNKGVEAIKGWLDSWKNAFEGVIGKIDTVLGKLREWLGFDGKTVNLDVNSNEYNLNKATAGARSHKVAEENKIKNRKPIRSGKPVEGATGGHILGEGMMYVHPNEFLVNNELTTKLGAFLSGSLVPPREPLTLVTSKEDTPSVSNNAPVRESVDNSINISEGAIQITMTDGNPDEVDSLVDLLWEKIERKRQIKDMKNYKPLKA